MSIATMIGEKPTIQVTVQSSTLPLLLDTGAQVCALPLSVMQYVLPSYVPEGVKEVKAFGNSRVTLSGPILLDVEICGVKLSHPFYAIDDESPMIAGYDLMKRVGLFIDVASGKVWARTPPSETVPLSTANQPVVSFCHTEVPEYSTAPTNLPPPSPQRLSTRCSPSVDPLSTPPTVDPKSTTTAPTAVLLSPTEQPTIQYSATQTPVICDSDETFVKSTVESRVDLSEPQSAELPSHLLQLLIQTTEQPEFPSSVKPQFTELLCRHAELYKMRKYQTVHVDRLLPCHTKTSETTKPPETDPLPVHQSSRETPAEIDEDAVVSPPVVRESESYLRTRSGRTVRPPVKYR